MSLTSVTVTGTYKKPDGSNCEGTVEFVLDQVLQDAAGHVLADRVTIVAPLVSGVASASLYATDDAGTLPQGGTYTVTEKITGASERSYSIAVPAAGGTVHLDAVAPVETLQPRPYTTRSLSGDVSPIAPTNGQVLVFNAATGQYTPGNVAGAVDSVNGRTGTVVLGASDVGAAPTTRTLTAGTGLTGGGDLSANRAFAADFGTGSGKVTQGNDSRLSDTRTPTDATVTTAKLAAIAANALWINATGSSAAPTEVAMGASTILARLAAGNVVAATPTQIKTLLAIASGDVSGLTVFATLGAGATSQYVRGDGSLSTFNTDVRANRLDQMATPTADVAWGSKKITGLANGSGAQDAAAFGQIPTVAANTDATTGTDTAKWINSAVLKGQQDKNRALLAAMIQMGSATPGLVAASYDPTDPIVNGTATMLTGRCTVALVYFREGQQVNSIGFQIATTAANTPTHTWVLIANGSTGVALATSADGTTTAMAATTAYSRALTSTWTCPASGLYWIGLMVAATTVPTLSSASTGAAAMNLTTGSLYGIGATNGLTGPLTVGSGSIGATGTNAPVFCPCFQAF